jgi:hypothetical protein
MEDKMTTFNNEDPLLNLTLDTDELGIWLVEELDNGLVRQMGYISWKEVTRGVQQCLLQEKFLLVLAKLDEDDGLILAEEEGELCPSCREPYGLPSGDGCAAMNRHLP